MITTSWNIIKWLGLGYQEIFKTLCFYNSSNSSKCSNTGNSGSNMLDEDQAIAPSALLIYKTNPQSLIPAHLSAKVEATDPSSSTCSSITHTHGHTPQPPTVYQLHFQHSMIDIRPQDLSSIALSQDAEHTVVKDPAYDTVNDNVECVSFEFGKYSKAGTVLPKNNKLE